VIQNFVGVTSSGNGIFITPTSSTVTFAITNTTVSNNGYVGIFYAPPSGTPSANGVIDHVVATGNFFGVAINGNNTSGAVDVAISNSIVSNNSGDGISVGGGNALTVSIDNTTLNGNGTGILANIPASVLLSRSVIQGNNDGTDNATSNTFYTYGNNLIDLNGNNFSGTALNSTVKLR